MRRARGLVVLVVLGLLMTGCSAGVSRTNMSTKEKFCCSVNNPVGGIELTLTEEGKKSLADNLKFDPEALKTHLERALVANSLMDKNRESALPALGVEVKDVRVRSNFSAVMWGFMAGNDHITGDIVIKDPKGAEMDRFEVSAAYALGGIAGGMDDTRMSWLYEAFASETIKELTKVQ